MCPAELVLCQNVMGLRTSRLVKLGAIECPSDPRHRAADATYFLRL